MRVLAIDYGDARTGIAVSDLSGTIVGQTDVIHSRNPQKTAEKIAELVKATGAERLVMGFPRNMDGSEGPRAALYRDFAALVERTSCGKPQWTPNAAPSSASSSTTPSRPTKFSPS